MSRDPRAVAVPSGRLSRLTRLGAMTAGVAGNIALNGAAELGRGKRPAFRDLLLTPSNIGRITAQLAQMRGAAMKVGQLVSMDAGDVLSPELSEIMARLRADADFMPPAQLKKTLTKSWGDGWLRHFAHFDVRPIAAASIGQVHRAQLKDGRDLAIKVQYPGVARSIDSDVANVAALIKATGLLPKGFDVDPYMKEACAQLHDETDYALEGRHMQRFQALIGDDERFILPELHDDWTRPDILAMSYVAGAPVEDSFSAPQEERDAIAHALFDLMLAELFTFGVMQTDPNFANYRYDATSRRIVLLDFGATREVPESLAQDYRTLVKAGLAQDEGAIAEISQKMEFLSVDTDPEHRARILKMMAMVFDAVDADELDFARSDLSSRMQAEGEALAASGFVPPPLPMDALFLQRKFGGIFLLATRLGARLPLREMIERRLS